MEFFPSPSIYLIQSAVWFTETYQKLNNQTLRYLSIKIRISNVLVPPATQKPNEQIIPSKFHPSLFSPTSNALFVRILEPGHSCTHFPLNYPLEEMSWEIRNLEEDLVDRLSEC